MTIASKRNSNSSPLLVVISSVVIIAALYFGKEVLVPFALAALFSFLLAPPVNWLEKLKIGRAAAVVIVMLVAFSGIGAMAWVGVSQLADIAIRLPQYEQNIRRKLEVVRNPSNSNLAKAAASINQVTSELSPSNVAAEKQKLSEANSPRRRNTPTPVPVQIVEPPRTIFDSLGVISASAAHYILTAGAVIILTLFMLMRRGSLRNKLFRLLGQGHLLLVTTALDDAANRVSSYLLTQSAVNGSFGLLLGFGLYAIGVPYAVFWGVLAALLRFLPYVGTVVAGGCPVILALATFDGWTKPLLTLGLWLAIEGLTAGVIEPLLYATHTGISSLAILLSATLWTLLWGPIGLVLSTPVTVCLLVLGRHVPSLDFLQVVLGDEPVLGPEARYYQRLLALDEDEAREVADTYLKEKSVIELYENVLIPALSLAERDRHQNRLDDERSKFIMQTTRELIEEIGEQPGAVEKRPDSSTRESPHLSIVCLPARDEADELVGLMLAQIVADSGHNLHVMGAGPVDRMLTAAEPSRPDVLLISALPPFTISHARSVCRRARQKLPRVKTILAVWDPAADIERIKQKLGARCSDVIVTKLVDAEQQLSAVAESTPVAS